MNNQDDKLVIESDVDDMIRPLPQKSYVFWYQKQANKIFISEERRFCFNTGMQSLNMAPWLWQMTIWQQEGLWQKGQSTPCMIT